MTDHWQGRPPTGQVTLPSEDPTLEAALRTIVKAKRVADTDEQFQKTVGLRLAAALAGVLGDVTRRLTPEAVDSDERLLAPGQLHGMVRLSHAVLNMAAAPPNCAAHELRQHRDHRPAWCRECGRDRFGVVQRPERP